MELDYVECESVTFRADSKNNALHLFHVTLTNSVLKYARVETCEDFKEFS